MKRKISINQFPLLKILEKGEVQKLIDWNIRTLSKNGKEQSIYNELKTNKDNIIKHLESIDKDSIDIQLHSKSYQKAIHDSQLCLLGLISKESVTKGNTNFLETVFSFLKINKEDKSSVKGIIIGPPESDDPIYAGCFDYFYYELTYSTLVKNDGTLSYTPSLLIMRFASTPDNKYPVYIYTRVITLFELGNTETEPKTYKIGMVKFPGINPYDNTELGECIKTDVQWILSIFLFNKFATTEIEKIDIVNPNSSPIGMNKSLAKQHMKTEVAVDFYTANWYTEIIRTSGFGVKGHWRNQPYKDGYKLIFIAPFQKHGYHRRAEKDIVKD